MSDGKLNHEEVSPTAATLGNPLFPSSGVMTYRALVTAGDGLQPVDVEAATGDEAAAKVVARFPGAKITNISPAPQKAQKKAA